MSANRKRRRWVAADKLRVAVEGLYGVEGPAWLLPDIEARLADPRCRRDVLRVARALESEPAVTGASAHLLIVARKPA